MNRPLSNRAYHYVLDARAAMLQGLPRREVKATFLHFLDRGCPDATEFRAELARRWREHTRTA